MGYNDDILYNRPHYCDKDSYIKIRKEIFAKLNGIKQNPKRDENYYSAYGKEADTIKAACKFNMAELIKELKVAFPKAEITPDICQMVTRGFDSDEWHPAYKRLQITVNDTKTRDDGYKYKEKIAIYNSGSIDEDLGLLYKENPELLSNSLNNLEISPYKFSFDKSTIMPDIDHYGTDVEDFLMDKLLENYKTQQSTRQNSTSDVTYLSDKGKITLEAKNEYKKLRALSSTMPKQAKETKRFKKLAQRWAERNNEFDGKNK